MINSLKKLKKPAQSCRVKKKLTKLSKKPRPSKKLEKKRINSSKRSNIEKRIRKIALSLLLYQEATPSKPQTAKRKKKLKIPLKLPTIAVIKWATLSPIVLNIRQKTSYSLGNFYIGDYQVGSFVTSTMYLLSCSILRK